VRPHLWVETIPYGKAWCRVVCEESGRFAAAFLVFLAAATGAGIVAPDFGSGTNRLGSFGLCGSGLILQLLLLAALTALDFASLFLGARRLDQE
jgi:hypothetical protein